ncbi:hypothetical protein [Pontibacter roseus]|uniref:hypothetical protein n=1 Tax=Pontibacter roseus TaxID=336989 RepID=UPI0012FC561B|nr:hypothetical protein [Pontibacter roseus]
MHLVFPTVSLRTAHRKAASAMALDVRPEAYQISPFVEMTIECAGIAGSPSDGAVGCIGITRNQRAIHCLYHTSLLTKKPGYTCSVHHTGIAGL